jgi:hypothetical protein
MQQLSFVSLLLSVKVCDDKLLGGTVDDQSYRNVLGFGALLLL